MVCYMFCACFSGPMAQFLLAGSSGAGGQAPVAHGSASGGRIAPRGGPAWAVLACFLPTQAELFTSHFQKENYFIISSLSRGKSVLCILHIYCHPYFNTLRFIYIYMWVCAYLYVCVCVCMSRM